MGKESGVKLIFNTSAGNLEGEFATDKPLEVLKSEVMERVHLDTSDAEQYVIAAEGSTLDEHRTLAELALPESTTLILWRAGRAPSRRSRTWDRSGE
jgi:hypothetical protein